MFSLIHKPFRLGILAMMLLLAGAANLFTVSVDNDGDEDTPPITVEMSFIVTAGRGVNAQNNGTVRQLTAADVRSHVSECAFHKSWCNSIHSPESHDSPEFVAPLRT